MAKGSSGIAGGGGINDMVFSPSTSDETADKLRTADDFKFSRTTVTMKDENGKTIGMVRGIQRVSDASSSKQFDVHNDFRKASGGVKMTELRDYGLSMENLYADGKKLYLFNNTRSDKFLQNATSAGRDMSFFTNEISKNQKKNNFLKTLESNGVIIINY